MLFRSLREGTEIRAWHNVTLEDGICHLDAWLKPLPPMSEEEVQALIHDKEKEEGTV